MKQQEDLDEVIGILGNPTRRLILERISHEPSYPLQIAKDMGLSQQLVTSHLKAMEESGIVISEQKDSMRGPKRKIFSLNKSLLITIELAPFLFNSRILSFGVKPDSISPSGNSTDFLDELDMIGKQEAGQDKINAFANLLQKIDTMLDEIENDHAGLLYVRNLVVGKASDLVNKVQTSDARRVLYYVLHSHSENVGGISDKLNLREETVRGILKQLRKDQTLPQ